MTPDGKHSHDDASVDLCIGHLCLTMDFNQLAIFYGGETGNSEDVAKRISWEAEKRNIECHSWPLDENAFELIKSRDVSSRLQLFICSTTGQGDVPRVMHSFWKRIMRKSLDPGSFSGVKACIVGLGDSSYLKYNFTAKKLFKRFKQLGVHFVLDLTLGDDQHDLGFGAAVDPFIGKLWDECFPRVQVSSSSLPSTTFDFLPQSDFEVNGLESKDGTLTCSVIENTRVTPETHFQETRLIKFKSNCPLRYSAGDVLVIYPENDPTEVEHFLSIFNLDPNAIYYHKFNHETVVSESGYRHRLHNPVTVKELVSRFLSIHSIPKRSFFDLIWNFSQDDLERQKLKEFASTEGQEEVYNYCIRPKRTILEVLSDFPNTCSKIPLNYLPDLIPIIKPREFSIASSPNAYPNEVHILVAVVKYKTRLKDPRTGLCSTFLSKLQTDQVVNIEIKSGTFQLPVDGSPLIMVGPGTGVAPLRSIIQDRIFRKMNSDVLFFGCRYRNSDYYFQDEWKKYQENESLKVEVAFSREDPDRKVYVQDLMWDQKKIVLEALFERNGRILISGNSNEMPQGVRNCLIRMIQENQPGSDGDLIVTTLENKKVIQYECWS